MGAPTDEKEDYLMAAKGVPLHNGSGRGQRANKGRGGCLPKDHPKTGKGQRK